MTLYAEPIASAYAKIQSEKPKFELIVDSVGHTNEKKLS
jgi:hypothetical protein